MITVSSDDLVITYTCSRCSRTTTDPHGSHWLIRAAPVIVAGITLGLCLACLSGSTPDDTDAEKRCEGKCGGDYRPPRGTYFEGVAGRWSHEEKWACWDEACVEGWADDHGGECSECGHEIDVDITAYFNGKRVRS